MARRVDRGAQRRDIAGNAAGGVGMDGEDGNDGSVGIGTQSGLYRVGVDR